MRHKRRAALSIGIDIDSAVIESWRGEEGVRLICGDAVAVLRGYSFTGREFVYADPPYLLSTRKSGPIYRYEYSDQQHEELLACLKSLACPVMVSGYWSELYDRELAGWNSICFESMTRGGVMATEWVWMNYPEPVELHDYSFLGETFRERERIKRKIGRWAKKLEAMPRWERQALYAAMGKVEMD